MALPQSGESARARNPSRRRLWLALLATAAVVLVVGLLVALLGGGSGRLPLPGIGRPERSGDPFAYVAARQRDFVSRATAGTAQVVFIKSPGGVMATAARVAHFRRLIDAAAADSGIDPNILEGIVFLESAGRPDVIAGTDPADASGLTQILAQTGQSLLGMHIDLARSRRLTAQMVTAANRGRGTTVVHLERQRAKIDDRFDPRKALAATVRYLRLAERRFGRLDLAVVSYHMGIGNLQQVLGDYDGGHSVPYAQLYFGVSPASHASAYDLLTSFGDDSSLYYWRVLAAARIMHLYRTDRGALNRLANLESATGSNADVLHPPARTPVFAGQGALYSAYAQHELVPLPRNSSSLGLAYARSLGSLARRLGATRALYRGLRAPALDLLVELAARVRALAGGSAPLIVTGAVLDKRYGDAIGGGPDGATAGYEFSIARHYVSRAQAVAFQAMLDRLQALDLIAWVRTQDDIEITVSSDASRVIAHGP